MDVLYLLGDPRVARWSHSVAELLLMRLAVAGFRMGGLRFLFLGFAVCRGRCSALSLLLPLAGVAWRFLAVVEAVFTRFWSLVPRCCELAGTAAFALAVLAEKLGLLTHPPMLSGQ